MRAYEHYLASLNSAESQATMRSALRKLAAYLVEYGPPFEGASLSALDEFPWHLIRGDHSEYLGARLAMDYSPRGAVKMASALRGVLREARRMGLMSTSDFDAAAERANLLGE